MLNYDNIALDALEDFEDCLNDWPKTGQHHQNIEEEIPECFGEIPIESSRSSLLNMGS